MNDSFFSASDGKSVYLRKWLTGQKEPKGVVQIVHGMVEHIERYEEFAEFLIKNGFHVVGHDQRGHGRTATKNGRQGYLCDQDGFIRLVDDVKEINESIQNEFNLPIILLGHSMGSFVARRFIQLYPNHIAGVILSGTGGPTGFLGEIGKLIAKSSSMISSPVAPGYILSKLTFGQYNKRFNPSKTPIDWLSRDMAEVERYLNDPLCGFMCTNKFYEDLFFGLTLIHKKTEIKKIRSTLPVFLFSGSLDPVGKEGKGVFMVAKQYVRAGMEEVEVRLYDDGRHEMLKETNRSMVFQDILNKLHRWLDNSEIKQGA